MLMSRIHPLGWLLFFLSTGLRSACERHQINNSLPLLKLFCIRRFRGKTSASISTLVKSQEALAEHVVHFFSIRTYRSRMDVLFAVDPHAFFPCATPPGAIGDYEFYDCPLGMLSRKRKLMCHGDTPNFDLLTLGPHRDFGGITTRTYENPG